MTKFYTTVFAICFCVLSLFSGASIPLLDYIKLSTPNCLMNISSEGNFKLINDINMFEIDFVSISLTNSTFNGNGFAIFNLNVPLFKNVENAKIYNLQILGRTFSDKEFLLAETVKNSQIKNTHLFISFVFAEVVYLLGESINSSIENFLFVNQNMSARSFSLGIAAENSFLKINNFLFELSENETGFDRCNTFFDGVVPFVYGMLPPVERIGKLHHEEFGNSTQINLARPSEPNFSSNPTRTLGGNGRFGAVQITAVSGSVVGILLLFAGVYLFVLKKDKKVL